MVDLLRLLVIGVIGARFNLQGGVVGAMNGRKRFMSVVLSEKREDGLKCLVYSGYRVSQTLFKRGWKNGILDNNYNLREYEPPKYGNTKN